MVTQLPDTPRARKSDPHRAERYRRALCESDLPSTARLIGHTIAEYADEHGQAELSRTELGRAAGLDRSAIQRNLPTLTGKSWLVAEAPPPDDARRGARTRYTIVIPSEAATVTRIEPGRPSVAARAVARRTGCTDAEAAAVVALIRTEAGKVRSMPAYLRGIPDDELAAYLEDVRAEPADAGAAGNQPEWCSDHEQAGGTLPNGQPRCPICRRRNQSGVPGRDRTPPRSPKGPR